MKRYPKSTSLTNLDLKKNNFFFGAGTSYSFIITKKKWLKRTYSATTSMLPPRQIGVRRLPLSVRGWCAMSTIHWNSQWTNPCRARSVQVLEPDGQPGLVPLKKMSLWKAPARTKCDGQFSPPPTGKSKWRAIKDLFINSRFQTWIANSGVHPDLTLRCTSASQSTARRSHMSPTRQRATGKTSANVFLGYSDQTVFRNK